MNMNIGWICIPQKPQLQWRIVPKIHFKKCYDIRPLLKIPSKPYDVQLFTHVRQNKDYLLE